MARRRISEAETRKELIDPQLEKVGCVLRDRINFKVKNATILIHSTAKGQASAGRARTLCRHRGVLPSGGGRRASACPVLFAGRAQMSEAERQESKKSANVFGGK
jgi:hypothetical protein